MTSIAELNASLTGRYLIEQELGQGGMATVYLAEDVKHHRKVAIKVLRDDVAIALGDQRFLREIDIAAGLTHPNIVPVYDSGNAGGALYYVMPFVAGEALRQKLNREGALPIAESVRMLREVADALAKAHRAGIVHRDIKPENILINDGHALVMDFGIARAASDAVQSTTLTQAGMAVGTPAYMAPEQAVADPAVDARADIYSFGVVAYEMLTGKPPFSSGTAQQVLAAHVTATPDTITAHRGELPSALAALVMRCLAKNPAERPQTATDVVNTLDTALTPSATTAVRVPRGPYPVALRWGIVGVCVAAALLFIVVALVGKRHGAAGAPVKTLAVLPFKNESGDTAQAYLAEGITDAVQLFLQKVPGLVVIGEASSAVAATPDATAQEIGKKLGVAQFVRATLRRRGDSIRVSAELVSAADGHTMWAEKFDRAYSRAYALDDDIAAPLVAELKVALTGTALAAARAGGTTNPMAYEQYLLGRHDANQLLEPDLRRALAHFDSAIAFDPKYANAYAGLAETWSYLADEYVAPDSSYPQMKAAALKAVELDSSSAEAHGMLADAIAWADLDPRASIAEFERAIALDSNAVTVREVYANILFAVRPADGIVQADRAIALDPLSGFASFMRAACLYMARRYAEAITQTNRTRELAPDLLYYDVLDAASYRELGDFPQALALYRKAQANTNKPLFGLGVTYARMRLRDSALRVAHDLEALSKIRYVTPTLIAMIYANLPTAADRDMAFRWLREGQRIRSGVDLVLHVAPEFDPIRKDPRFVAILAAMKQP